MLPAVPDDLQLLTPRGLRGYAAAKEQPGTASTELTELVNCEKKEFLPHRDQGRPSGDHDVGGESE
jgi:hypothetical protein